MRWMGTWILGAAAAAGAAAPAAAHDDIVLTAGRGRLVVTLRREAPRYAWAAGRWETRVERVILEPGFWREEVLPAVVEWRLDRCRRRFVRVEVRPATWVRTWVPERAEERVTRTWIPGRWVRVS